LIAVTVVVVFCVVRRCKKNQQDGTTTEDKSQVSEGKSKESVKTAGQKKGQKKGIKGDVCGDVQPKTVVPKEDDDKTQKTDLVSLVGFLRFWQF
jgi:hypothetical protein